ncbi:MAG: hypothetical protein FJ276_27440 [Planctomycetes bacterium]|nr:hypothetical protein [Planctomycetota bacterium]
MLERNLSFDDPLFASWNELGVGAPTLIALAQLCCRAMVAGIASAERLSPEAKTILVAARKRGLIEIKATNTAYESPARLLTVHIEVAPEERIRFRSNTDPHQNIRFFEGFRQLCASGLVMHHLCHEFSLTQAGFECAAAIPIEEVRSLLELAQECGIV